MKKCFLNVGSRIKNLLDSKGIKQVEACKLAEISKNAMSNYINGNRTPDTASLYKLSKFLGVSMEWILTGKDEDCKIISSSNLLSINDSIDGALAKGCKSPKPSIELIDNELDFIDKYRQLPKDDKEEIEAILNIKFDRICIENKKSGSSHNDEDSSTKELA